MGNAISDLLFDIDSWRDPDNIHGVFAQLRMKDPLHYSTHPGFPELWHATKHADIFEIERNGDAFLNAPRLIVMPSIREEALKKITGGSVNLIKSVVTMDKPEHLSMRLLTQSWFMPKNLRNLQTSIETSASDALDKITADDGNLDFARDVAMEFPLRVIMTLMGIGAEDYPMMLRLTQELFGPDDPDTKRDVEPSDVDPTKALSATYAEFQAFFAKLTEARRENPTDDLASVIANAVIRGEPIGPQETLGYYIIVATAGHDTTSYSLNEAVRQLALDSSLLERLKADPENMAPKIAEEAIRFASPVRHFVRTANQDYELRGKTIKAGQSVVLWYPSGSRDEDVFEDADRFDVDRSTQTRHTAFGHGAHLCLGMHLARQEISTFLKLLAARIESIVMTKEPKFLAANFVGGIKSMPIQARIIT